MNPSDTDLIISECEAMLAGPIREEFLRRIKTLAEKYPESDNIDLFQSVVLTSCFQLLGFLSSCMFACDGDKAIMLEEMVAEMGVQYKEHVG